MSPRFHDREEEGKEERKSFNSIGMSCTAGGGRKGKARSRPSSLDRKYKNEYHFSSIERGETALGLGPDGNGGHSITFLYRREAIRKFSTCTKERGTPTPGPGFLWKNREKQGKKMPPPGSGWGEREEGKKRGNSKHNC